MFILTAAVVLASAIALLLLYGVIHSTSRKDTNKRVGPPTKLGIPFIILNFIGDHIYYPLFKKRLILLTPKSALKRRLPIEIEREVMGPTADNFEVGLKALSKTLNDEKCFFTTTGQFAVQQIVYTHAKIGSEVTKYLYDHQKKVLRGELEPFKPVQKPLIICGLPRTGSTLLFSLLAQDPKTRALRNWEMFKPFPPPTKETIDTDPRINKVKRLQKLVELIQPNFNEEFWKIHYYEAHCVEEELLAMMPNLMLITHAILLGEDNEFSEWYLDQEGKEYIYVFLRKFIELMGTNYYPETHWVMKTPVHSMYPGQLMKAFPDANVIIPHRDPVSVIPSWTKLCTYVLAHYVDESDTRYCYKAQEICRTTLKHMSLAANRLMEYRDSNPTKSKQFCDIYYQDIVKDPITTIKGIYKHFGFEYSEEFEQNMKKWLKENPQGKYGRVSYSLKEYDVTKEEVDAAFAQYLKVHPRCRQTK